MTNAFHDTWLWVPKADDLTALSTFFLAVFTIALIWTSGCQARLTRQSIDVARVNFQAAERAFVFLDGFNSELTVATDQREQPIPFPEIYKDHPELCITRFAIQPKWKNSGNTPTRRMSIQVDWKGPEGVPPLEYSYRGAPKQFFVAPKATEPSEVIEIPTAGMIVDWAMRPLGVPPKILIWGRADYEDIFGGKHFVEWCYQLRFSRPTTERMTASFNQFHEHNGSDEDMRT